MSYSKDWRSYPPSFKQLIEAAALRRVVVPCGTPEKARSMKNRLHSFFGVLRRGLSLSVLGPYRWCLSLALGAALAFYSSFRELFV